MDAAQAWQKLFETWPNAIPKEGMVITSSGDNVTFVNFMTSPGLLVLERDRPDATGARKVMVAYSGIISVKMQSTMEFSQYKLMGFQPR